MILDLPESALGTKEHWDAVYEQEGQNFDEFGDEGEIWFGRACERRIIQWISKKFNTNTAIVDLGSGNGHLLLSLAKCGFTDLAGIDYSLGAVRLGQRMAQASSVSIHFEQANVLDLNLGRRYDLIVDKGTFDAISLGPQPEGNATPNDKIAGSDRIRSLCQKLKASLCAVMNPGANFLITSCNWTRSELETLFAPELVVWEEIEHASFLFGGASGQAVTTLAFRQI